MDYEQQKFKRDKSSIVPIEEVYTDLDIKVNDPHDPSVGFRFDTPRRWAQDKSKNKSVGIRDLKLTPSSGDIKCRFVHYINGAVANVAATWNTDHYDINYGDLQFESIGNATYYISDVITENITPNNGFEEVITDLLLTKLSDSVWKQMRKARKEADNWYLTYAAGTAQYRCCYLGTDDANTQANNKKSFPVPSTFYYTFDNDTCKFNVNTNEDLRIIRMTNASTLREIDVNGKLTKINVAGFGEFDAVDSANAKVKDYGDNDITNGRAYIANPTYGNSELLLIIRKNDISSLKGIYALFNQQFPTKPKTDSKGHIVGYEDDLSKFAEINIDHQNYYIPFVYKQGNSFISHLGSPYTSYFCLSNKAPGRNADNVSRADINNLNLNNVWDRIHLIYHATFAETRGRIIGRNNDHWDSPNKRFIVPDGDQDEFYLKFSTDGKHNILPLGCHFNVDLCFMLNTTNNYATGNRDAFR